MARRKKYTGGGGKSPSSSGLDYRHSEKALLRPEAGSQQSFSKKKSPQAYRYDSSLAPELSWDENETRSEAERLIASIVESDSLEVAKSAANKLKRLGDPFLEWSGKAERNSFTVPTLPLFVHERLSTKAILNTLEKHKRDRNLTLDLFNEGSKSITDAIKGAYEHKNGWQNRLILGDSLQVMNSLLQYENMGRQVQMVYMDPPYGIKYGSNFQPFVRQRKVVDGEDDSISREPETVQAFRDTWELGLHSWLTYMRDRLLLARELLTDSGSCFVQISDENVHYVRNIMDEVFGRENFVSQITYRTSGGLGSKSLTKVADFLVWYSKTKENKYHKLFKKKDWGLDTPFKYFIKPNGEYEKISDEINDNPELLPKDSKICRFSNLLSSGYTPSCTYDFELNGKTISARNNSWKTNKTGMEELIRNNRVVMTGSTPSYVQMYDDFQFSKLDNVWNDFQGAKRPIYAVQTNHAIIERCILMTTDPGDLVFDPTCGSGTTPYASEKWGRRWIASDLSRVPLALTRQRLLTEVYPYYQLQGQSPSEGFVYQRKTNNKGKEIGGIVPYVTLKTVANNEKPEEVVLIDKPNQESSQARVSGPFCIEAVMPPPVSPLEIGDIDNPDELNPSLQDQKEHIPRMMEILRLSPKIRMSGNKFLELKSVMSAGKSPNLHAEAQTSDGERVAVVYGPANGAIGERIVLEAAREAGLNEYDLLLVIAFAIEPSARQAIEKYDDMFNVKALYVQASTDLVMSDLLKNLRSSHTFAVCGLPEIELKKTDKNDDSEQLYQVSLLGLDSFDPASMEQNRLRGNEVPCWMLDPDYDGQCFRAGQVFFPRTGAWDKLKKSISAEFDESALEHLKGTTSAPFLTGEQEQIAVKAIDMRGNELLVVKKTSEAV